MSFDFLEHCRPGMVLKTRDRREARITAVAKDTGLISGTVPMLGDCAWRADGRFHRAPAGAAGPWDLMPPIDLHPNDPQPATERRRESLVDALRSTDGNPGGNPGCCD